jgi:hypothetical protein
MRAVNSETRSGSGIVPLCSHATIEAERDANEFNVPLLFSAKTESVPIPQRARRRQCRE